MILYHHPTFITFKLQHTIFITIFILHSCPGYDNVKVFDHYSLGSISEFIQNQVGSYCSFQNIGDSSIERRGSQSYIEIPIKQDKICK